MARRLVEETPRLRIGALARAGVFAGRNAVVALDFTSLAVRAEARDDIVHLEWQGGGQEIVTRSRPLAYGERRCFVAPGSGDLCLALYLVEGSFISRSEAGLSYSTQRMDTAERAGVRLAKAAARLRGGPERGPSRGAVRKALLDELRAASPEHLTPTAQAELDRAEAQRRRTRRRRPLRSDPPSGTRWALLRGRRSPWRMPSAAILTSLASAPETPLLPAHGLPEASGPPANRAGCPELDIRTLRPRAGRARGWLLRWEALPAIWVMAAIPELPARRLMVEIRDGEVADRFVARQELAVRGGRRRGDLFFLCPVSGRRVSKLFLREGRFASARAQRLR